jgi:hypothetical protein
LKNVTLTCRDARRIVDPVTQTDRHFFVINVLDIPGGIPQDPNPREQNIDKPIYKKVRKHLLNDEGTPNTFYVKNKGITMLADEVSKKGKDADHVYELKFKDGNGIVDGAHTYKLILDAQEEIKQLNSANDSKIEQFVKVEVLTRAPEALVPEIAGGLNTAVQVQEMSLADLGHDFDWIKDEIKGSIFEDKLIFKQNQPGEYTVIEVLGILDLFNVFDLDEDDIRRAKRGYENINAVFKAYRQAKKEAGGDLTSWEKLRPILKDVLSLHDKISGTCQERYNSLGNKKGGLLKWIRLAPKNKAFSLPFTEEMVESTVYKGALMPMLGAFRSMVEVAPATGLAQWVGNDFQGVLTAWHKLGPQMADITQETSEQVGRRPDAIGKSSGHWRSLYLTVKDFARSKVEAA